MLDKNSDTPRRLTALDDLITYRLARLQARLNAHAVGLLRQHSDLSLTQWRLLTSLRELGTSNLAELVRELQFDKAQLSRGIKGMSAAGLVEQSADEADSRKQVIRLTPKGIEEHERLTPVMRGRQTMIMAHLDDLDRIRFFEAIDAIHLALDEAEEGSSKP
ncbi:MAG: MarR family winged helix-turn-helix transcriptional regulator [Pseudomonadota bacterium]